MAEGQRRRVLDTGLGTNILSALTGSIAEQLQKKRQAEQELKQVFAKALLEEELKNRFDPERQAKTQAMEAVNRLSTLPRPVEGFNQAELQARVPEAIAGQESTNRLKFLQQYGLLPKPPLSLEDIYARSQATAEGRIAAGGTPEAISTLEERAAATGRGGAQGRQQVKYEDLVKQFNFISEDVDSVLGFLEKVPAGRLKGPGAQVGAVFGMEGSENVLQYTRTKDLILSKIAKTFGGEVGVLTEGDIQRISKGFPALWMNERERVASTQWVKDYIQRRIDEYRQSTPSTLSGQTVGRFTIEAE